MYQRHFADKPPAPPRHPYLRMMLFAALVLAFAGCPRSPAPSPAAGPSSPTLAAPPASPSAPPTLDDWTIPDRYRGQLITKRVRYFPRKLLALTFDDGPDSKLTPQVLNILAEHRARATFFVLGENAEPRLDLLRQMAETGHAVGSHSYRHIYKATPAQAAANLEKAAAVIEQGTGKRPSLFRPPGGFMEGELARLAQKQGYAVMRWTISSADTTSIGPEVIARNVIHTPNPGDIVLMHDGSGHGRTVQALPQILRELGAAGFEFVTLPELLRAWDEWLRSEPAAAAGPGEAARG